MAHASSQTIVFPPDVFPPDAVARRTLADALAATGTDRFGARLLNHLQEACGADYCAMFRLEGAAPSEVATGSHDGSDTAHARVAAYLAREIWSRDPAMVYARTRLPRDQVALMRVDVRHLRDDAMRETIWPRIRDRLVIAGGGRRCAYTMSILREGRGGFTDAEVARIGTSAELLIRLLEKHADLTAASEHAQHDAAGIISELPRILACLSEMSPLARREAQVCARILNGWSTTGIALDLGIGNETVKTHRKLAYRRLGIGSERELLTWYLGLQARWPARP